MIRVGNKDVASFVRQPGHLGKHGYVGAERGGRPARPLKDHGPEATVRRR